MNDMALDTPGRPAIRKFNPGTLQSDEEVIGQFAVREHELRIVLEVLRGNVDTPSCQHVLLVGPRGRGKTMLLARVAAALRTDGALSGHLLPVRFMEESQEIFDLADFWLEALFYLSRECAPLHPELARDLRATHDDLTGRQSGNAIEEHGRSAVLEAADRLGRKLVLMVENLQSLRDDVDADFGWKLREVLQSEPQIVLVGTATSRFEGLDDAEQPFFELFRIVDLTPLTTDQCRRLWRAVSGDAVSRREIRPLEILTGGSPRLLVIVAEFARHRSLLRLMEELVRLIDDHTEYFRGHLEVIPKTERRVYLAVIDLWRPSSSGEVAARSRLDVRTVSTMLGRLVARGAVVLEGSGRKRRYAAAERLYSIYYKLRRERDEAAVVHNLVRFMGVFYGEAELSELSDELNAEAARSPAIREGIRRAMEELPHGSGFPGQGWLAFSRTSNEAGALRAERVELSSGERETEEIVETARQILKRVERGELDESDAAIAACEEVIERFGDSQSLPLRTEVAKAFHNKGVVQGWTGAFEAAIATYDEAIERFGDSNADEIRATIASSLINRGAAEERTGEVRTAIATYGEVLQRFGDSETTGLQAPIACALVNKGEAHERIGEAEPALAMCDEVIQRFGDGAAVELQEQVARALTGKGRVQWLTGEPVTAIATCDEVVERFEDNAAAAFRIEVARALCVKGMIQGQIGHSGAAIATCNSVVERFQDDDAPELRAQVAMALLCRSVAQLQAGDVGAVMSTCDEVVERFGASDVTEIRIPVAVVLAAKGALQGMLGDTAAAIATCEEAVDRFGESDAREVRGPVGLALVLKAVMHGMLGDTAAAIAACDELSERFRHDDARELRALFAMALTVKRVMQGTLGMPEAVIAVCDDVVALFLNDDSRELQALVAAALAIGRAMQGQIGEPEAVIAVCGNLLDLVAVGDVPEPHALVATMLLLKGTAQGELGQPEASIATLDELVRHFGDSDIPEIKGLVATAVACKGERQVETGCAMQALQTCAELDRQIGALTGRQRRALEWQAGWLRTQAHIARGERPAAMDAFRSVYATFLPGDERMMRQMLERVPDLIAAGAAERDLVDILSSDREKSDGLLPLVVALRERVGEEVRAPVEVIEVASDIRERIMTKLASSQRTSSASASSS